MINPVAAVTSRTWPSNSPLPAGRRSVVAFPTCPTLSPSTTASSKAAPLAKALFITSLLMSGALGKNFIDKAISSIAPVRPISRAKDGPWIKSQAVAESQPRTSLSSKANSSTIARNSEASTMMAPTIPGTNMPGRTKNSTIKRMAPMINSTISP